MNFRAKGAQRQLAMIARRSRLLDGGLAVGKQAGEQQAGLDLRAGHGDRVVMPCSRPPEIRSGAQSSVATISAPILRSGSITRFMGRRESDSSPISSLVKGCAATMPDSMRMVEPELPQFRALLGACNSGPMPSMMTAPSSSRSTVQPKARTHPRVLLQSAPGE